MIERHVTLQLLPDRMDSFQAFFAAEYSPALAAAPGFGGAELLRPLEPDGSVVMVLRFSTVEAAQAWRESPRHKRLSPTLKSHYQTSNVRAYDIVAESPGR